jgi:hypothetical protein
MHFRGWVNMQDTSPSNHKSPSLPRVRDHSLFPGRDPSRSSYVAHAKGFLSARQYPASAVAVVRYTVEGA